MADSGSRPDEKNDGHPGFGSVTAARTLPGLAVLLPQKISTAETGPTRLLFHQDDH
jgi:hypothetical protein